MTIVANKSGLRTYNLNKFDAPSSAEKVLKGLNFASDEVFGDLPRWFLDRFVAANGNNLTVKPKPIPASKSSSNPSNSNQPKRNNSAASQQPYKNQKTNNYSDQSVFRKANQAPKGGGNSSGNSKGRGKGS